MAKARAAELFANAFDGVNFDQRSVRQLNNGFSGSGNARELTATALEYDHPKFIFQLANLFADPGL